MNRLVKKRCFKIISVGVFTTVAVYLILLMTGILWIKDVSDKRYPVKGVDVSHYQGLIDWEELARNDIQFAFIKATEGSKTQDECFKYNWENSHKTKLLVGAYHFFSFDSSGEDQAKNFIGTVSKKEGALPPVVDFEFYGNKSKNRPDTAKTVAELKSLVNMLELHYEKRPIIYTTLSVYNAYIKGNFEGYMLWIRNTYFNPNINSNMNWTFWQYSDKLELDGYEGDEKCIDFNVFNGSIEEFNRLFR